ncbi:MAG: hypothetical protein ACREEJ_16940, partial [Ensifer adhaerens]
PIRVLTRLEQPYTNLAKISLRSLLNAAFPTAFNALKTLIFQRTGQKLANVGVQTAGTQMSGAGAIATPRRTCIKTEKSGAGLKLQPASCAR